MGIRKIVASTTWPQRWEVDSHSSDSVYIVARRWDGDEWVWGCSCPSWRFKRAPKSDCGHITEVKSQQAANVAEHREWIERNSKEVQSRVGTIRPIPTSVPVATVSLNLRRKIKLED